MLVPPAKAGSFRARFTSGERLLGTFIKTPTGHATEILGHAGFDFMVIDEEHAPFDRQTIDQVLLAARASNIAGIVRVAEPTPSNILSVLDCGATGVLVPHVASAEIARRIASAARYSGGNRGFSNSPRAGGYGARSMAAHIELSDAETTVIAMIEDVEALDAIDDILATEGVDGIFIGRGDLAVALGAENANAPEVMKAVEHITAAARAAGKPICVMVGAAGEAGKYLPLGATSFIVSSDQGLMRRAGLEAVKAFAELKSLAAQD